MPNNELSRSQLWNFSAQPEEIKEQIIEGIAKNG